MGLNARAIEMHNFVELKYSPVFGDRPTTTS
jgi:hypothetical protein